MTTYNYNGIHYKIYGESIISGSKNAGGFVCNNPEGEYHCTYLTHKEYDKIFKSISMEKTGTLCPIKNNKGDVIWNIKAPFDPSENTHKRCDELNDGKFMCFHCLAKNNTQNWGLSWSAKYLPDKYKQNEKKKKRLKKEKNKKLSVKNISKKNKKPSLILHSKNNKFKFNSKKIVINKNIKDSTENKKMTLCEHINFKNIPTQKKKKKKKKF